MEWNDLGVKDTADVIVRVSSNHTGEWLDVEVKDLDLFDMGSIHSHPDVIDAISSVYNDDSEWLIESGNYYIFTEEFYEHPTVEILEILD